jgi:hypothetical protein
MTSCLPPPNEKTLSYATVVHAQEDGRELWWAPTDDRFVEAARLWARGWLSRKWHDDDLVYRLSAKGAMVQALSRTCTRAASNLN